jgi:glycosyltransferase involved in cell wall biosynthesis
MLSVVVCAYNQNRELAVALEGWRRQTCQDFVLVVVRDGGDENPQSVLWNADPVRLIYSPLPNSDDTFRLAAARNQGVAVSHAVCPQADYIVFTDADCVPDERFVELHAANMCYGKLTVGFRNYCGRCYDYDALKATKYRDDDRMADVSVHSACVMSPANCYGVNLGMPKAALVGVNGFDEDFESWGWEDVDLATRLQRLGYDWTVMRDCFVWHIDHPRRSVTRDTWDRKRLDTSVVRNPGRKLFAGA